MDEKVREILEKIKISAAAAGEFAAGAGAAVGKKAGEVVETTKLNLQIFDLNGEVSSLYRQIGELIYKAHANPDTDTEVISELLENIDSKKIAVEEIKVRLEELRHTVKCPNPGCGARCQKDDAFCPKCGTKLNRGEG